MENFVTLLLIYYLAHFWNEDIIIHPRYWLWFNFHEESLYLVYFYWAWLVLQCLMSWPFMILCFIQSQTYLFFKALLLTAQLYLKLLYRTIIL